MVRVLANVETRCASCPASMGEMAAAALTNLCESHTKNKVRVEECGGRAALLGLLARGGSRGMMEGAVKALHNLCT